MAELPPTANAKDIESDKRWSISALWEVERHRIESWIVDEAVDRLAQSHADAETAKRADEAVLANIRLGFVSDEVNRDARLITMAGTGQIEREAGSLGFLRLVRLFLWLAMICEVGFFVILYAMGLGNPFLVMQGMLLAAGAFVTGNGLHALLRLNAGERFQRRDLGGSRASGFLLLLGGLTVVLFILWLRNDGSDDAVAILVFTSALALAVIVLTTYHKYISFRYDEARQKMFMAQRWYASDQHKKACDEGGGYWRKEYQLKVDEMARNSATVLKGKRVQAGAGRAKAPGSETVDIGVKSSQENKMATSGSPIEDPRLSPEVSGKDRKRGE